jgi:hypothetical protein
MVDKFFVNIYKVIIKLFKLKILFFKYIFYQLSFDYKKYEA